MVQSTAATAARMNSNVVGCLAGMSVVLACLRGPDRSAEDEFLAIVLLVLLYALAVSGRADALVVV